MSERDLKISDDFVTTMCLCREGIPEVMKKGQEIRGLDKADGCVVFHAGTKFSDAKVVTSGGRVLVLQVSWSNDGRRIEGVI